MNTDYRMTTQDIINHYNKEIERLRTRIARMQDVIDDQQEEIEEYQNEADEMWEE